MEINKKGQEVKYIKEDDLKKNKRVFNLEEKSCIFRIYKFRL